MMFVTSLPPKPHSYNTPASWSQIFFSDTQWGIKQRSVYTHPSLRQCFIPYYPWCKLHLSRAPNDATCAYSLQLLHRSTVMCPQRSCACHVLNLIAYCSFSVCSRCLSRLRPSSPLWYEKKRKVMPHKQPPSRCLLPPNTPNDAARRFHQRGVLVVISVRDSCVTVWRYLEIVGTSLPDECHARDCAYSISSCYAYALDNQNQPSRAESGILVGSE